jgi:hypothetical protein
MEELFTFLVIKNLSTNKYITYISLHSSFLEH